MNPEKAVNYGGPGGYGAPGEKLSIREGEPFLPIDDLLSPLQAVIFRRVRRGQRGAKGPLAKKSGGRGRAATYIACQEWRGNVRDFLPTSKSSLPDGGIALDIPSYLPG